MIFCSIYRKATNVCFLHAEEMATLKHFAAETEQTSIRNSQLISGAEHSMEVSAGFKIRDAKKKQKKKQPNQMLNKIKYLNTQIQIKWL